MSVRAVAEVNLSAIERNAARLRERVGAHTKLCAVVKADGYGHGAGPAAKAALRGGASSLAVATADEAVQLMRELGRPSLVLGALSEEELRIAVVEARAEIVAWDLDFVELLKREAEVSGPVSVHVKLDTGLGRLGTRDAELALAVAKAVVHCTGAHAHGCDDAFRHRRLRPGVCCRAAGRVRAVRGRGAGACHDRHHGPCRQQCRASWGCPGATSTWCAPGSRSTAATR